MTDKKVDTSEVLEEKVDQKLPWKEQECTVIKYYSGEAGEYLGQVFGKAIIPGIMAYFAYQSGAPPESLILAPGVLYVKPIYKIAKFLGGIFGKIGKSLGKQIPTDIRYYSEISKKELTKTELEASVKKFYGSDYKILS